MNNTNTYSYVDMSREMALQCINRKPWGKGSTAKKNMWIVEEYRMWEQCMDVVDK